MCIFLGYAAGVGKTYAMLEAAHDLKKSGVDVVAGYIEPHERAETRSKEGGAGKQGAFQLSHLFTTERFPAPL